MGIWPVYKSLSYGVGIRKHVIVVVVLIGKEGGDFGSSHRSIEIIMKEEEKGNS